MVEGDATALGSGANGGGLSQSSTGGVERGGEGRLGLSRNLPAECDSTWRLQGNKVKRHARLWN